LLLCKSGTDLLYRTEGSVGRFPVVKITSSYVEVLFISIGRLPFVSPTLENADPLFTLVTIPGFYLHYVEVVDQKCIRLIQITCS